MGLSLPFLCAIAGGGALGALCRYGFWLVASQWGAGWWGTLLANASGCFAMGVLAAGAGKGILGLSATTGDWRYGALSVGFLGALTTFSTFSLEALHFLKGGHPGLFLAYLTLSLTLSLGGCALGFFGWSLFWPTHGS